jgi:hypothetical protein
VILVTALSLAKCEHHRHAGVVGESLVHGLFPQESGNLGSRDRTGASIQGRRPNRIILSHMYFFYPGVGRSPNPWDVSSACPFAASTSSYRT